MPEQEPGLLYEGIESFRELPFGELWDALEDRAKCGCFYSVHSVYSGITAARRCDSRAAVKRRWLRAVSSGVAQPANRVSGLPSVSSCRKAAHIWRIESLNPNSKIGPVIALNAAS